MSGRVDYALDGDVAVLTIDHAPVNAVGLDVRRGLDQAMARALADPAVRAVVLIGRGRHFSAGADISEFGPPMQPPTLFEVQDRIEGAPKPVVAALRGVAYGGGLELALCCHYRVGAPSLKAALPEVKLGLSPGAGGALRLPRLTGVERALEIVAFGDPVTGQEALACGLIDALTAEDALLPEAVALARRIAGEGRPPRRLRDIDGKLAEARGRPEIFAGFRAANAERFRGLTAPDYCIRCVENAVNLPFEEGLARERALFRELMTGEQSAALRYAFFAERRAAKAPHPGAGKAAEAMARALSREAEALVAEGAAPEAINAAFRDFGFEAGRPFPEAPLSGAAAGAASLDRCLAAAVAAGKAALAADASLSAADIDAAWLSTHGWPRHRGGPLYRVSS